jgi:hypothetical protein
LGYVGEFERATSVSMPDGVVAVEPPAQETFGPKDGLAPIIVRAQHASLNKEYIQIAVIVVIEQRDARPDHLRVIVLARHAVEMDKVNS